MPIPRSLDDSNEAWFSDLDSAPCTDDVWNVGRWTVFYLVSVHATSGSEHTHTLSLSLSLSILRFRVRHMRVCVCARA